MMSRKRRRNTDEIAAVAKRVAVYSAVMLLLTVIECSFFAGIDRLPATPDLVIAAVAVIAFIDTRETAAVSGIVGGVIADAIGGVGMYLSPALYLITALTVSLFAKKMMAGYPSWLAVMPAVCLMRGAFTLLEVFLFGGSFVFGNTLLHIILPEMICTAIFALPLYPLIALCSEPLRRRINTPLR